MHRWRSAASADIPEIARVAAVVHPAYPERAEIFAEKIRLAPAGCHVLDGSGTISGYVLSHPWTRGAPPKLDALLGGLPADPDCWYIHDLALLSEVRGQGAAQEILATLEAAARAAGLPVMALVAVGRAGPFWRRQGYHDAPAANLAGYGADAAYMEKPLIPA